jgi:predicted ribosomally synthesized peptide with SipW-like signal peptide
MRLAASSTAVKIFASVVLVGGAASVAGLGTFGAFTSTTTASESVASGKVVLSSAAGAVSMATPVADMVPGDVAQRAVTLTRSTDTTSFGSVKLTTTASTSNALTSGVANGLTVKIDQCSVPWTKAATTNDLSCTGTTTAVVAQRAVIGADLDLAAATTTLNAAGAMSYLRVSVSLPAAADNTFQGLSNTLTFTFDGTQRAANTAL